MRSKFWMIAGLVSATLLVIAACGGGPEAPTTVIETADPGPPPHVFVGTVSVDGSAAPDGTVVTAFIEGKTSPVIQAEVSGGRYKLMVEQPKDADYDGKAVTFTVSDLETTSTVPWEFGGANEVNLSVSSNSGSNGGVSNGAGGGDLAAQGRDIFTGSGGCGACHTVEGISSGAVGPDLTHIGAEGESRKPGMSSEDYLTESIRDPEAFVATGVERAIPGIMTQGITAGLSDVDVDALVAFLMEQK